MVVLSRDNMGRRGMYEVMITFFLIVVLVFSVIFFLYLNAGSASVYRAVSASSVAPQTALEVKDAVLSCHRLEYLDEQLMNEPCRAKEMLGGYRVRQYGMNGCVQKVWDYTRMKPEENVVIPFVVAVENAGGKRCLASLDVVLPAVPHD